jgi:hypothetical protein
MTTTITAAVAMFLIRISFLLDWQSLAYIQRYPDNENGLVKAAGSHHG